MVQKQQGSTKVYIGREYHVLKSNTKENKGQYHQPVHAQLLHALIP